MTPEQLTITIATAAIGASIAAVCWYARRAIEHAEAAEVALAVAVSRIDRNEQEIIRLRDKVHHLANDIAIHILKE